jgi:hypothetical protein
MYRRLEQVERGLTDKAMASPRCLGASNGLCANSGADRARSDG